MAGAGYKLYSTGDVLSASDVNTYLQQQTVMVFASAAARTTALASVLAEGMVTYLKDTDVVEIYTGAAWVSLDDPNAIQNSIVTAKGDLIGATASGTPARLAVGNSGEQLVADSSATSGLRYQGNFAAGKNAVINGNCQVAQRGSSVTFASTTWFYGAVDRFLGYSSANNTATVSQQSFSPGTAPVAGYEAQFFVRSASTSTATYLATRIEDVRTFAGQTVTLSFYAKTDVAQTLSLFYGQNFGSGGSANVDASISPSPSATTSWTRFTATFAVPSIIGKTVGSGSYLQITITGAVNKTIDLWGLQLEAGSVATAFQTATGTIQGELAACQRYYQRIVAGQAFYRFSVGGNVSSTQAGFVVPFRTSMRTTPTFTASGNFDSVEGTSSRGTNAPTLSSDGNNTESAFLFTSIASANTGYAIQLRSSNNVNSYIDFSAEL